MGEEKPVLNWVQRRAMRQRILDSGATKVWDAVREAIEDACDTFNEHYPQPNQDSRAVCRLENGSRIKVSRTILADMVTRFRPEQFEVLIRFEKNGPAIEAVSGEAKSTFKIDSDEESAFAVLGGKRITPDEISEKLLEPVLFPKANPRPAVRPLREEGSWMA